ncbi:hypothetical protein B0186_07625 [Canicola haemoglobinophilus]|uniref:Uncharacterized protein n=1 Tax=Canicola haemoglobinophilus TaxID=733 RepID=A0A1V4B069_9PAST|nr:DUF6882 domain-containing protein [Canicola haemoglobinophilus]OOR99483.1 hypothetical protein B0186_07625 [Canicola haemoglobinophilus]STO59737.1 Uncharacterised protein [Canicola haemoglobinophilus]
MLFKKLFGFTKFTAYKSFSSLYDQYAIWGFEKQLEFAQQVEGLDWEVDLSSGQIKFNQSLVFPVQILGSFSFENETWLWAWANTKSNIPTKLLSQVKELRAYGKKYKISELTKANLRLSINDIHSFGLVALGMFDYQGYYVGNFGSGALLMTIPELSKSMEKTAEQVQLDILSVYSKFISMFEIKAQKKVLKNYVTAKKYVIVEDNDTHLIARKGEKEIIGIFDEQGKILQLKG